MRNGKRLLAGFLATMTVFTSIPINAMDISVPTTLNVQTVSDADDIARPDFRGTQITHYNFVVRFYDEAYGTNQSFYITDATKKYVRHAGDPVATNFDLDISEMSELISAYSNGADYTLGTPEVSDYTIYTEDCRNSEAKQKTITTTKASVDGTTLHLKNVYSHQDYRNTLDDHFEFDGYTQIEISIPFSLPNGCNLDSDFEGSYDHGYFPNNALLARFPSQFGTSNTFHFAAPRMNLKKSNTTFPVTFVEADNTLNEDLKTETVYLESRYIHNLGNLDGIYDTQTGVEVTGEDADALAEKLNNFDTNPNPSYTRTYTCNSDVSWEIIDFNEKNYVFSNDDAYSKPIVDTYTTVTNVLTKAVGSDPVEINGKTYYKTFTVDFKLNYIYSAYSYDAAINRSKQYNEFDWSDCFGTQNSYAISVINSSRKEFVDYYNIYDDDKANAEFIASLKESDPEPAAEKEGYEFSHKSESGGFKKTIDGTYRKKVYRYFVSTGEKTFSYKLKYKAVYEDGTPAKGVHLRGEITGDDGFISGVDTHDVTLNYRYNSSADSERYEVKSVQYSPDELANFSVSCNDKDYVIRGNFGNIGYYLDKDKNINIAHSFERYSGDSNLSFEAGEDKYTTIAVFKVKKEIIETTETKDVDIPIKVNYYYQENGNESLVTSENTSISASVKTANGNVIEAPSSYELRNYDITSGLQAVADNAGVDVDALSLVSCTAGDRNGLAPVNNNQTQSVDMLAKTLLTTYNAPTYEEVITFTNLKDGAWIVNVILKSSNKVNVTVHYKDKQGNTLHADNKYQFVDGEAKTEYIVEAIKDYVPLGRVNGYIPHVGVVLMNASETGTGTNGAYLHSDGAVNTIGNYELTVYYEYDPYVRIYNVINYDYENATYVGTANCNPNTSYYLSVGDYNKVDIQINEYNDSIVVPKLTDDSVSLKGYSLNKGNTNANTLDNNTMISTNTKDMDVYICYVTPVKLKVVDEFYKSDGTTLVSSTVRSEETYDAGHNYSVSALPYNQRGSYTTTFDTPSNKRGTLTSDTTVTFKYKSKPAYVYVFDYYFDEDGNKIDDISGRRVRATVDIGDTYSYAPKTTVGYELWEDCSTDYAIATPKENWSGTVDKNYTYIYFCYKAKTTMNTLTVKDKYLDASGVEEKTDIRQVSSFAKNSKYSVSALDPEDYEVVGQTKYEGTLTEDTVITFVYQKKMKDFTLTIKDKYLDENGVEEKTDIRPTQTIKENESYNVDALNPEEYDVIGDKNKSGVATSDVVIEFVYQKKAFTITVKDKYLDADGKEEKVDTRLTESKGYGCRYSYNALNPDGYAVISQSTYSGTLTKDTEVTFTYQKDKYYTVTVLDEYVSVDGDVQKTDTRLTTSKKMGENYSYNALTVEGYVVTSESTYSGVVNSDVTVKFVYQEDAARFVTVKGYITYTDGTPIANKRIEIHSTPRYAVTNEFGYYEIKNVEVGDHKFKIFADDTDTALVTCDLSVTKPNEDTVKVTFKTDDCEVETDTSMTDVLKIDAILPLYKITVKDEYYDGTTLEKSVLRVEKTVKSGDNYSFEALNPDGYTVTSALKYEGVALSNLTLVFKYTKKVTPPTPEPEPTKYNVKVIDTYYSASMALIKSEVRLSDTVVENTPYKYDALNPAGFTVTSDASYSGVVTKDLVLIFTYKENEKEVEPNKYNLKVVDSYYDADGNFEKSDVRESKVVTEGTSYLYKALNSAKYNVIGATSYNGQVIVDTVLEFKYQAVKTPEPKKPTPTPEEPTPDPKEYTVTVIDKYIVGVKNVYSDSVFGGLTDSSNVTIQKIEGSDDYIVTVERVVRCKDVYKEGATYSYNAEAPLGFTVISDKAYSGVVTKDITLEFIYAKGFDSPEDIPEEIIDADPTPVVPFEEPKTGDTSIPVLPIIFLTAIIFVAYKKRKRV